MLDEDYLQAEKHTYYFYNTIAKMQEYIEKHNGDSNGEKLNDVILNTIKDKFIEVMDDDFNTTAAIANLHIVFKHINNLLKTVKSDNTQVLANSLAKALEDLKEVYVILGFFEQNPKEFIKEMQDKYLNKINLNIEYIEEQIKKRAEAKASKNFELADQIRSELDEKGIILNDSKEGTTWDLKQLY